MPAPRRPAAATTDVLDVIELICNYVSPDPGASRLVGVEAFLANPEPDIRRYTRIAVRGWVEIRTEDRVTVARVLDIGAGGVGVHGLAALAVGAQVDACFTNDSTAEVWELPSVVAWVKGELDGASMGLLFRGTVRRRRAELERPALPRRLPLDRGLRTMRAWSRAIGRGR